MRLLGDQACLLGDKACLVGRMPYLYKACLIEYEACLIGYMTCLIGYMACLVVVLYKADKACPVGDNRRYASPGTRHAFFCTGHWGQGMPCFVLGMPYWVQGMPCRADAFWGLQP